MEYHIKIFKGDKYFIGFCDEIPGAMTQGETIEELKENMIDAIQLMLNANIPADFSGQTPICDTVMV